MSYPKHLKNLIFQNNYENLIFISLFFFFFLVLCWLSISVTNCTDWWIKTAQLYYLKVSVYLEWQDLAVYSAKNLRRLHQGISWNAFLSGRSTQAKSTSRFICSIGRICFLTSLGLRASVFCWRWKNAPLRSLPGRSCNMVACFFQGS